MCSFPWAGATLYAVKFSYQREGGPVDIPLPPRLGNHNLKKSKLKWHVPALEYSCKASLTIIIFTKYDLSWSKNTSMLANNRHWPLRHYVIITSLFPSHPQGDMPSPNTWDTAADAPEACHASVVLRVPCTALRPWPRWGRCGWGWHRLAAPRLIQFRYNVPRAIINHARLRVNRGYIIVGYAPIWDDVKWPPDGWFVVYFWWSTVYRCNYRFYSQSLTQVLVLVQRTPVCSAHHPVENLLNIPNWYPWAKVISICAWALGSCYVWDVEGQLLQTPSNY